MKTKQAPHKKLTEEEVKSEVESLLSNHLKFKNRWEASDWEEHEFDKFMMNQQDMIFNLRRHFSPETVSIMHIPLGELSDMLSNVWDKIKESSDEL